MDHRRVKILYALVVFWAIFGSSGLSHAQSSNPADRVERGSLAFERIAGVKPRNIVLFLIDDLRYDAMGFLGRSFLKTPNIDRLAHGGVYLKNAFVTTSLCSPSRASILTGLYAHQHRVVDNNNRIPPGTVFFPQYLQASGYRTAFIGKWHMGGDSDAPRPGFDRWVSFRGQGSYLPSHAGLNVDGKHVPQKGYITDELTDYALDWLGSIGDDKPFFLYLSHKAVHGDFIPAERHKGLYRDAEFVHPKTQADTPENRRGKPMWAINQRNSWHGVDFAYHKDTDIAVYFRLYCETLLAVDESVGRVLDYLKKKNQLDSTLIIFMGDNGFAFGEHGLIDKRTAYEESMRIPMLMYCPELFAPGTVVEKLVANVDVAPTALDAAGVVAPKELVGFSLIPLAGGKERAGRDAISYEYFWERNFPQTPTIHAIRTERYKYIHYYGIWDIDELYDIKADPLETENLIFRADYHGTAQSLNKRLFDDLEKTGGMFIPLYPDRGGSLNLRRVEGASQAQFPPELMRKKSAKE